MKIDQDLRLTIKSAEKQQTQNLGWSERQQRDKEAVADLLKRKPALAAKIAKATAAIKKAEAARAKASAVIHEVGLGCSDMRINNEEKFVKAGGKLTKTGRQWKYDAVIMELAAAEPKQAKTILAKYGIKWE